MHDICLGKRAVTKIKRQHRVEGSAQRARFWWWHSREKIRLLSQAHQGAIFICVMHNSNSSWLSYCVMSSLICMSNTEWKSTNTRRGITRLKCGFYEVKRARFFRQPPRVSRFPRMECAFLCNTYPKHAFNPAGALRRLLALLRPVCCKSGCQMPLLLLITVSEKSHLHHGIHL